MLSVSATISKHLHEVFFGGNWTASNVKDTLDHITWKQAVTGIGTLNQISVLTYHIGYYAKAILGVLEGKPLDAKDAYSFDCPPVGSEAEWQLLKEQVLGDAARLTVLVAAFPEDQWEQYFTDRKYGTYYRNLHGLIEHTHYHLGQIALLSRMTERQSTLH